MKGEQIGDPQVLSTLKSTFGYSSFRPLQADIVRSILWGQDVFVLMPTGGGKSLCYQLPALLLDGLTVVVSPLIALMKDQVDKLQALGVAASFINSSLSCSEVYERQGAVVRGEVKLLYVAPERLMMPGFLNLLSSVPLACFAIDEAHCISEWGHDFRPEYRQLSRLRELFPAVPFATFTATATRRVEADIKTQLGLEKAASFRGSFNRQNLFYEVRPKRSSYQQLVAYLRERGPASGIIYCQSRAGTERLADMLNADRFKATAYHAGLESGERRQRQEAFIRDNIQIIVATIAFGMGIDKPDVRFVIHYDLPKSLEGYYQESGRAGRDGEPSDCILFYSYSDMAKHRHFIDEKPTAVERQAALEQLQQMADWANSSSCRRRAILEYFGEQFAGQPDPCCDVCRTPLEKVDYTVPAQMLLSCARRTDERFGIGYLIDVLRGSRAERVLRNGHDRLSVYGIGRELSREEWGHLARGMLRAGYITQDQADFNAVKVSELGRQVLFNGEPVLLAPSLASAHVPAVEASPHQDLFDELRTLRKRLADERGVPPYVIFHDRTLMNMAAALPTTREELLRVEGVGQRKLSDFGDEFLACVNAYTTQHGLQRVKLSPAPMRVRPAGLSPTIQTTLGLFAGGMTISDIAAARQLSVTTVEGHLAEAMEAGELVDITGLVSAGKRRAIEAAMAEVGMEKLAPVMEKLGEGYTYGELRLVRAALVAARLRRGEPG